MQKDISQKKPEEYNDVFADIFNALLFDGEPVLLEQFLIPLPTESFSRNTDGSLRQGNRDIRKADHRNGRYRLICGKENQNGRDNTMPERIMGYDFASYEEQIKQQMAENKRLGHPAFTKRIHGEQKLAPVITMTLYWGVESWEHPLSLHDMLEFPTGFEDISKPLTADYPIHLIQMAHLPQEIRNRLQSDFRLLAEYAACEGKEEKLELLLADDSYEIRHPEEFLDALSAVARDSRYEEIKTQIQSREETEVVTMCVLAEKLEKRGMEKGMEKGIEKGIERGIEKGIFVMITDYAEDGKTKPQILDKLKLRFQLSQEAAEHYYHVYLVERIS